MSTTQTDYSTSGGVIPFTNGEFELTITPAGDSFHVLAPALAKSLGHREAFDLLRNIPDDEKGSELVRTPGGDQRVGFVTEAGFYRAIGQRQAARIADDAIRAQVERFQSWVYADVIPSIRRHGAYATPATIEQAMSDPDSWIRILTELKRERTARAELAAQAEADAPKVLFAEAVASSSTSILVRELAKHLHNNGVNIGGNRLFELLREQGYLIKAGSDRNLPTQKAVELGLFEIKCTPVVHDSGAVTVSRTPKVTGKGQTYFVNHFLAKGVA